MYVIHVKRLTKGHLDGHIRTRTGEKSFSCKFSEKTLSDKGKLNLHLRTLTGLKHMYVTYVKIGSNQFN